MQATAFNKGEGLKVVATEKDGIKVLRIKKEINEGTEHDTPCPMTGECYSKSSLPHRCWKYGYITTLFENSGSLFFSPRHTISSFEEKVVFTVMAPVSVCR